MKRIIIFFGNITFDETAKGNSIAIVHNIDGFIYADEDKAEILADETVNITGSYIIPSKYKGVIKWEC